jgi:hypothetical protein
MIQNSFDMKIAVILKLVGNLFSVYETYFFKRRKTRVGRPTLYINSKKFMLERTYAFLIYFFHEQGYQIYIKNNLLFLANLYEYTNYLFSLPAVKIDFFSTRKLKDALVITDKQDLLKINKKVIVLRQDVASESAKNNPTYFLPFSMIPRLYYNHQHVRLMPLRNQSRTIRIFFSGNTNVNQYNHPIFEYYFKKLSRNKIIQIVKENFNDRICDFSSMNSGFNYENQIVLSEWQRNSMEEKTIKGRTTNESWLRTLSMCDFFIACPGFIQPMCHNLIESMSVGVIPILEHPEFLNPPLQHGINCITFSGGDDLIVKIKEALVMSKEEREKLRANVLNYYDNYLSPEAVVTWLEKVGSTHQQVYVITSDYFVKYWQGIQSNYKINLGAQRDNLL